MRVHLNIHVYEYVCKSWMYEWIYVRMFGGCLCMIRHDFAIPATHGIVRLPVMQFIGNLKCVDQHHMPCYLGPLIAHVSGGQNTFWRKSAMT